MDEIEVVPEGPLPDQASTSSSQPPRMSGLLGCAHEPFDSEKVPPKMVSEIRHFLRVANQIQNQSPRAAYLCRFHAFEKAHILDPTSSGRGVRQFKTSLLQRLEQDAKTTNLEHKEKSDARELELFYQKMKLAHEHAVASVLLEVLNGIKSKAGSRIFAASEAYGVYNILPLDSGGSQHAIMHLPEIKAAISAVRNVQGLPVSQIRGGSYGQVDLLGFLQYLFGFQSGNVANQREHLVLLLANIQVRQNPKPASMSKLDDRAVDELMIKLFQNYLNWCNFLGRTINIWLPSVKQQVQQYKILYIGLYLLIWGEASNLRLMPECLCYIFHYMAYDLYGFLSASESIKTGEKVVPAYGGEPESFLKNVVTPIYRVILEEAAKSKNGTSDHSTWRNYDDLNEYFWSADCFKLGWPLKLDTDFFCTLSCKDETQKSQGATHEQNDERKEVQKWVGKTNFVEIRSFWHLFRSFDRMWTFFILVLQAMIIMASHDLETPFQLLDSVIFNDILSIFITNALLRLIQVTLDIAFTWKARKTMNFTQKLRFAVKFIMAAAWTITLPVSYANSMRNCLIRQSETGFDDFCLSSYIIIVGIYLASNVVGSAFFLVPAISNYIETSNWWVCKVLSWYSQPQLYIGRGMQESQVSLLKYTIFWLILLSSKILFSYHFEIKPVVESTKQIVKISVNNYEWHELFPQVKNNAGAILAVWAPIILVYFMDTQIWYSIFCTIFGGVYGIFHHLGEIRTMGMVKSRFHTLPSVFAMHLVPPISHKQRKKCFNRFLKNKIFKDSEVGRNDLVKFALVWNNIICSFRSEDLISNKEMDLMMMPLSVDLSSSSVRWTLFLLATKFSTAINMGKDFVGTYEQLHRKIEKDKYMSSAIKECYHSLKNILNDLLVGELE